MTIRARDFFEKKLGPATFGGFLSAVRELLEISQSDLARKLKVRRSMICDIEKGRVLVSPALAVKIAKLGGFPIEFAVKYALQDQLRRAHINMTVSVKFA